VAYTGELVPSARCEEYLCKVKQKREELEKVYINMIGRQIDRHGREREREREREAGYSRRFQFDIILLIKIIII